MAHSVTAQTITLDFTAPARTFDPALGVVGFHLGCNALASHPNCGLCNPTADLDAIGGPSEGITPPCERYYPGDPCACGMH